MISSYWSFKSLILRFTAVAPNLDSELFTVGNITLLQDQVFQQAEFLSCYRKTILLT